MADSIGDIITQIIAESKSYVAGLQTAASSLKQWGGAVEEAFKGIEAQVKTFSGKMDSVFNGVDQTLEVFRFSASEALKGIGVSFKDLKSDTDSAFKGIGKSTKEFTGNTDEVLRNLSRVLKQLAKDAGSPIKGFKALRDETDSALKGVTKSTQEFNAGTGAALKELNNNLKEFSKAVLSNLDAVKAKNKEVAASGGEAFNGLGSSLINFKNIFLATVTAVITSRLVTWIGDLIEKAEDFDAATRGLKAAAGVTGQSFDELNKVAKEVSSGGLISFEAASKGLKNFVLFGFSVDQARAALIRIIDQSILFGSSRKALESNVLQASDAFRLMNDELLKNIGIEGGLTGVATRAGIAIETLQDKTTRAGVAQQIFNQFMQDTASAAGVAEEASKGWSGAAGQLTGSLDSLKVKLGEIIETALLPFLNQINPILTKLNDWLALNKELLAKDLTAMLESWAMKAQDFQKSINLDRIESFTQGMVSMGEKGRIALNVLSIMFKTVAIPIVVLSGIIEGLIRQLISIVEVVSGSIAAALLAVTGQFTAAGAAIDGVKKDYESFAASGAEVSARYSAAVKSLASGIAEDFSDIRDASDSTKQAEENAAAARLRASFAIVNAKDQEVAAAQAQTAAEKEHAEFMEIAKTKGIEAASQWLTARQEEQKSVEGALPAVVDLTRGFEEQATAVDKLTGAVQGYATALAQIPSVGPTPGNQDAGGLWDPASFPGMSRDLNVEIKTDWPTAAKKVSEAQHNLELQGYRPGD